MSPLSLRFMRGPLFKERGCLLIFFLTTGFAFYFLGYAPLVKKSVAIEAEVDKLRKEAADYQLVVSSAEKDVKRLEEIMAAYKVMEEGLLFVKERLPSVREVSAILREVSGRHAGITFLSIQPLSVEDKGLYMRYPVTLQIRGDFPSFGQYLSSLDASKRLIGVENINMVREAQDGVLIKAELNVYLLKEGAL